MQTAIFCIWNGNLCQQNTNFCAQNANLSSHNANKKLICSHEPHKGKVFACKRVCHFNEIQICAYKILINLCPQNINSCLQDANMCPQNAIFVSRKHKILASKC